MRLGRSLVPFTFALVSSTFAAEFCVPGVDYPAQVREEISILPGGRVIRPFGKHVPTGTAPFAVAVSPNGNTIVTANIGITKHMGVSRPSITVIVPGKRNSAWSLSNFTAEAKRPHPQEWQGLTSGLAVTADNSAWVSEGDSGRVVELNLSTGERKAAVTLNSERYSSSFTDALLWDASRNLLIVLDQANSRAAIINVEQARSRAAIIKRLPVIASVKTGVLPVALALSGDGKRLYVANTGDAAHPPSLSIIDLSDPYAPKTLSEVAFAYGSSPFGNSGTG